MMKVPARIWRGCLGVSLLLIAGSGCYRPPASRSAADEPVAVQYLNIPTRSPEAIGGKAFAKRISAPDIFEREGEICRQILAGNVPSFSRTLTPVRFRGHADGKDQMITLFVACDYLAIGSTEDYFYAPLTPLAAQFLATRLDCTLPTSEMVDLIYEAAELRLKPQPIPPSDSMTTVAVFLQHNDSVRAQIAATGLQRSPETLVAGHKKDLVISNKIYDHHKNTGRVVIYGWHRGPGLPIQPEYNGHHENYADYSHGVRLIANEMLINGKVFRIPDILKNPALAPLLTNGGIIRKPFYPAKAFF